MTRYSPLPALALLFVLSNSAMAAPVRCGEDEGGGGACAWGRVEAFDGQSLQVRGLKISLAGLQVPERKDLCIRKGAAKPLDCGLFARKRMGELVRNGVACDILDIQGGQLVGTCRVAEGDLGLLLVQAGAARAKDGPYDESMAQAVREQKGLWAADLLLPKDWDGVRAKLSKAGPAQ